jgi:hypothetical protein
MQYAAVLGTPPVKSAHDAVKAAIADPLLTSERTVSYLPNLRDAGYGKVGSALDPEGRFCPNCAANVGPGTLDIIGCPCCGYEREYGEVNDDDDEDDEDEEVE